MTPVQIAQARHHSYSLFSQLFLGGVTAALFPFIESIPLLKKHLPPSGDEALFAATVADEMAAAHFQLFGYYLHPFESIFLDASGLVGGVKTEAVIRAYHKAGFAPAREASSPDHIGVELAFLAFLLQEEAQAISAGSEQRKEASRQRQRHFLESHLLCWLPAFLVALQNQEDAFFGAVGKLTLALAADHYGDLKGELPPGRELMCALPDVPDLLHDPQTGLNEIAHFLVTPPLSGLYLGKREVGVLGRALDLPRGFGDRQQLLLNLLRTAVQYGQLAALFQALAAFLATGQAAYQQLLPDRSEITPYTLMWAYRLEHTISLIAHMEHLANLEPD